MSAAEPLRPGWWGRFRSRQGGNPSGPIGRLIGRLMVNDTAAANDRAVALLRLVEPSTVLDLGCGQGRTVAELVKGGHVAYGVDPSPTMVSLAHRRNRIAICDGRADVLLSDGTAVPLPDGAVDAAFTAHTTYFMPDPLATFTDVARALRPGGAFVVACHTADDALPSWADPTIYRPMTAAGILDTLARAGFTNADIVERDDAHWPTYWFTATSPNQPEPT